MDIELLGIFGKQWIDEKLGYNENRHIYSSYHRNGDMRIVGMLPLGARIANGNLVTGQYHWWVSYLDNVHAIRATKDEGYSDSLIDAICTSVAAALDLPKNLTPHTACNLLAIEHRFVNEEMAMAAVSGKDCPYARFYDSRIQHQLGPLSVERSVDSSE